MVDVSEATFEAEVLERSDDVPVVVDLWAEWCGPCKTLGPILEKVVGETEGEVALAKVDVDANPQLSQMFQVQGIPAVFAVHKRKVVSQFVGAVPESQVRQFVAELRPSPEKIEFEALVEAGDEESLHAALEIFPGHEVAIVKLAELFIAAGEPDEALAYLAKVPESAETKRVAAMARIGTDPTEEATDQLADVEPRLKALLDKVKDDDAARQEYLDLLELMGSKDPRTVEYRRELSRVLF